MTCVALPSVLYWAATATSTALPDAIPAQTGNFCGTDAASLNRPL